MEDFEKASRALFGDSITCNKELRCVNGGLENVCKAADEGDDYLICLEDDEACSFRIPVGARSLCKCPVRMYIKKELGY